MTENKKRQQRLYPVDFINQIIKDDALSAMKGIPEKSVDLVVTSPPYNLKNSSGNGMRDGRGGKWSSATLLNGYEKHHDCMPHDQYVAWQRQRLTEMLRVTKDPGAIFYNHKWRVQRGLLQDRQDIVKDFPVRQIIILRRKGGINFNPGYFLLTFEVVYLIRKKDFKPAPKANAFGDVWEIPQEFKNTHPAPFPVKLTNRIISSYTGDIVLDPFMGSGTTAISALNYGWDYIGIDSPENYCCMANKRIQIHKKT